MVKKRSFDVHRLARTSSTQDVVRRAARSGAPDGYCCLTDEQTSGRGRLGRRWLAPPGTGLLASVLLRLSSSAIDGIPFAAGLAVVDALERRPDPIHAGLKWPNDVFVEGRKLAGLLAEIEPGRAGEAGVAVIIGLGMNLSVRAFPEGIQGVSLHELTGSEPDRDQLLEAWLEALDARVTVLEAGGVGALIADWRSRAVGLGHAVTIVRTSDTVRGTALDIADDGALLVQTAAGVERVVAGDVNLSASPAG